MDEYDVALVGSGHNGLTCAAYLAKAGLRTCVIERRHVIGGATVTEELWPGFQISRASYVPGIVDEVIDDLELPKFGLKTGLIDPQNFMPFPDGRYLFTYKSREKEAQEIAKFSKKDSDSFLKFASFTEKFVETIEPLLLVPPPSMVDLLTLMKGNDEMDEVIREILMTSCKDLLNEHFESEEVKAELCMHGVLNTSMGIDTIGTSYILANSVGKPGYRYAVGGTGGVAQALALCFTSHGGEIRTDCDVERISIKDGKANGIDLVSGEKIKAKIVVSNADPKRTFLKLVEPEHLENGFKERVRALRAKGTSLKINIAMSEPLDFKSLPGTKIGPQHQALTDIAPSMSYVEKAYDECNWGRIPEEPPLNMFCQTASDPTCAPAGKHTLSIIAKYHPYHLSNGSWDDNLKERAQENSLAVLEKYAPHVRKSIMHIETLSPLDMETIFALTEGNVTHLDQTLNQMLSFRPLLGWASYRTPINGLYLCGAGTHPGGGVSGAPGHNAAQVVIEDWSNFKS
jgi:phytoene dehydrogenase-like protein